MAFFIEERHNELPTSEWTPMRPTAGGSLSGGNVKDGELFPDTHRANAAEAIDKRNSELGWLKYRIRDTDIVDLGYGLIFRITPLDEIGEKYDLTQDTIIIHGVQLADMYALRDLGKEVRISTSGSSPTSQ